MLTTGRICIRRGHSKPVGGAGGRLVPLHPKITRLIDRLIRTRSAWCRERGLYPAELDAWKQDAIAGPGDPRAAFAAQVREDRRRFAELERGRAASTGPWPKRPPCSCYQKNSAVLHVRRGRMTRLDDRRILVHDIEQACADAARLAPPWSSRPPTAHIAPCLGDVRCWELAFLPAQIQGRWFCLHLILDLYSRKIVGSRCVTLTVPSHAAHWPGERPSPRGACRAGTPGAARLQRRNPEGSDGFGHAAPSCSRRRVGDDNAFAEALFSIPKYRRSFRSGVKVWT